MANSSHDLQNKSNHLRWLRFLRQTSMNNINNMNNRKVKSSLIDYGSKNSNDCFLFQCLNEDLRSRIELNNTNQQSDIVISFGFGSSYKNIKHSCVKINTLFNEPQLKPDDSQFDYYIGTVGDSLEDCSKQCYIPFWFGAWCGYRIRCSGMDFDSYLKRDFLNREFCSEVGHLKGRIHRKPFIQALEKQYKKVDVIDGASYKGRILPNTPLGKLDYISKYRFQQQQNSVML